MRKKNRKESKLLMNFLSDAEDLEKVDGRK